MSTETVRIAIDKNHEVVAQGLLRDMLVALNGNGKARSSATEFLNFCQTAVTHLLKKASAVLSRDEIVRTCSFGMFIAAYDTKKWLDHNRKVSPKAIYKIGHDIPSPKMAMAARMTCRAFIASPKMLYFAIGLEE